MQPEAHQLLPSSSDHHGSKLLVQPLSQPLEPVEPLGGLEPQVVHVGQHVNRDQTRQEPRHGSVKLLHLPRQLQVLEDVPAGGGEDLVGQLKAVLEGLGEAVELGLTERRQLVAGVLDLEDDGLELLDGGNKLLGARLVEAGLE